MSKRGQLITIFLTSIIGFTFVSAWTGPTEEPPYGNISAPVNTSSFGQYKEGSLRVSGVFRSYSNTISGIFDRYVGIGTTSPLTNLDVFGNAILSGLNRYLNFGSATGSPGYGLRDNNGIVEFRDSGGSWSPLAFGTGGITGSGETNYLAKWTGATSLSKSVVYDDGAKVGIGTANPNTTLTVYNPSESATLTDFTQSLSKGGINIISDIFPTGGWNWTPGIFWSTYNNNPDKPKAGIFIKQTSAGTIMLFGTSNDYSTGLTNTSLQIYPNGDVNVDGKLTGNGGRNGIYIQNRYCVGGAILRLSDTCQTRGCASQVWYDCNGNCDEKDYVTCSNTFKGWLH